MANENKLTTLGQMRDFAEQQDARDDAQDAKIQSSTTHAASKSNPHGVTAAQVGAVPTGRKVNGKALSADITLSASDVGAAASSHSHDAASTSAAGFMSATDKSKLDGIATGANAYSHPAYTARTGKPAANATPAFGGSVTVSQITSDATGHVTGATDRTITIPSTVASTSAAGLMSATDKSKLDGIAAGANAYSHPASHPASMITGLATVATSGSYNDLSNKPTIPAAVTVDSALSSTSTNPVQNKVVNSALAGKLSASGGTVGGDITMSNSASAQSGQPKLQWKTVGSNTPFMGFAADQTDGTFVICSMEKDTTTNGAKYYRNGLAIGGGSGNLFWKGVRVATTDDVSSAIDNVASITNAEIDALMA